VNISNAHNLHHAIPADRPYGIRVGLKAGDPFIKLVGADWQKLHWFGSERERDAALADMSSRYPTFRIGDEPSLTFEKIERPGAR
jgi:hypothetical protein